MAKDKGSSRSFHQAVWPPEAVPSTRFSLMFTLTSVGRGTGGQRRFGLVTGPAGAELAFVSACGKE
jgi:hypothetical protein